MTSNYNHLNNNNNNNNNAVAMKGIQYWEEQRQKWRSASFLSSNNNINACSHKANALPLPLQKQHTDGTMDVTNSNEIMNDCLDWDCIIEYLFCREQRWKIYGESLPVAIPLGAMVDILVDHWEAEGY